MAGRARDYSPRHDSDERSRKFARTENGRAPGPFRRAFYVEPGHLQQRSAEAVGALREKMEIHIIDGQDLPGPVHAFEDLPLPTYAAENLRLRSITVPTPIQAQGIPIVLQGRDFIGISQTGTGKTLAFLLPALIHIDDQLQSGHTNGPVALVLAPTRELALQIAEEATKVAKGGRIWTTCFYGGGPKWQQIQVCCTATASRCPQVSNRFVTAGLRNPASFPKASDRFALGLGFCLVCGVPYGRGEGYEGQKKFVYLKWASRFLAFYFILIYSIYSILFILFHFSPEDFFFFLVLGEWVGGLACECGSTRSAPRPRGHACLSMDPSEARTHWVFSNLWAFDKAMTCGSQLG